jgi:hypothetical protein
MTTAVAMEGVPPEAVMDDTMMTTIITGNMANMAMGMDKDMAADMVEVCGEGT